MRQRLLFGFLVLSIIAKSQPIPHVYAHVGLNRIGVLYDAGGQLAWSGHQLYAGLRFYAPDIVFEKKAPGLQLGYCYLHSFSEKFGCFLGADFSFFHEQKGEIRFNLIDPKIELGVNWKWTNRMQSNFSLAFGQTQNYSSGGIIPGTSHYAYLNYEAKFGITYLLSRLSD